AQVLGDAFGARAATEGILLLNKELAGVKLYQGMALADQARQEPPEGFLGGLWRKLRGQPTTNERALSVMQEAYSLDKQRPDIPLQMGNVYAQMGDPAKAAELLKQAQQM